MSNYYLIVPPEVKVNPYTGDIMKNKVVEFNQQQAYLDKSHIKKWIF